MQVIPMVEQVDLLPKKLDSIRAWLYCGVGLFLLVAGIYLADCYIELVHGQSIRLEEPRAKPEVARPLDQSAIGISPELVPQ
jgi:hypothetical protein